MLDWQARLRAGESIIPPPIFPDGDPTQADLALALALFEALDSESQSWYGEAFAKRLRDRLANAG